MHLARLETRVALNALFDRLPELRLDQVAASALDAHIQGDSLFRNPTSIPFCGTKPDARPRVL